MKAKTFKKKDVQRLFKKESMLIGLEDGIPLDRAAEIFGECAISYVRAQELIDDCFREYIGMQQGYIYTNKPKVFYLTLYGAYIAATCCNIRQGLIQVSNNSN